MRRLLGPRGAAARHDVLNATGTELSSEEETDCNSLAAHREAGEMGGSKSGMEMRGEIQIRFRVAATH